MRLLIIKMTGMELIMDSHYLMELIFYQLYLSSGVIEKGFIFIKRN